MHFIPLKMNPVGTRILHFKHFAVLTMTIRKPRFHRASRKVITVCCCADRALQILRYGIAQSQISRDEDLDQVDFVVSSTGENVSVESM